MDEVNPALDTLEVPKRKEIFDILTHKTVSKTLFLETE